MEQMSFESPDQAGSAIYYELLETGHTEIELIRGKNFVDSLDKTRESVQEMFDEHGWEWETDDFLVVANARYNDELGHHYQLYLHEKSNWT